LHAIGEDTSEMLDIVPAQLRVRVIRRPRYGCRACEEAVVQAPAPERPITGGMATRRCSRTCWWPSTPTTVCPEHTNSEGGVELYER
jgi:transposase